MAEQNSSSNVVNGDVFLLTDRRQSFASAQAELLKAIADCGSISQAAKRVGISYKTAWDRIDAMNNMSNQPLVTRSAGGAKGGGTALTELGKRVVAGFDALQHEHRQFIERLGNKIHSLQDVAGFIRAETIKASARNQFIATVSKITKGIVSAEVELTLTAGQSMLAMITLESVLTLNLQEGDKVIALVKSPSVMISTAPDLKTSASNTLPGTISRIVTGSVNSEVVLDLGEGKAICAIITDDSVERLNLSAGQNACAVFSAHNVTLLKED